MWHAKKSFILQMINTFVIDIFLSYEYVFGKKVMYFDKNEIQII